MSGRTASRPPSILPTLRPVTRVCALTSPTLLPNLNLEHPVASALPFFRYSTHFNTFVTYLAFASASTLSLRFKMKSFVSIAAVLTISAIPALARRPNYLVHPRPGFKVPDKFTFKTQHSRGASCELTDDLCATCDGGNVTDAGGHDWAVSCGWSISSEDEEPVQNDTSHKICLEACGEDNDCWAVNMADNACTLVTGDPKGLTRQSGSTILVRLPDSGHEPHATSTSRVHITATIYGPGAVRPSRVSITSTTSAALAASSSSTCDLKLTNLCPQCDGTNVKSENGSEYSIHCGQDLYSNSSYSPQEWMSPGECLTECNKYDWCEGTVFHDDRNCELAKGDDVFPTSKADYTAFLPVPTRVAVSAPKSPSAYPTVNLPGNYTQPSPTGQPTYSILPISSGCDSTALSCPACDGTPYVDKLNGSYTVVCGVEPDCVSVAKFRDGAEDQEQCIQSCDQDATCLAIQWWPKSSACHACQQGLELNNHTSAKLDYVLLVADIDGDDYTTTTSTTIHRTTIRPTYTSTSRSITDLPRPFTTSSINAIGPVGPVIPTSIASATRANPGGPIINITIAASTTSVFHLTTSSPPATITNIGSVSCPASNHSIYVVPDNGNYFAVACDEMFTAAHSRYTSATDFGACAASCTGQCDGVQFGYATRCGLYTDISVVGPGAGWTVAASITFPIPVSVSTTAMALSTSSLRRYSSTAS